MTRADTLFSIRYAVRVLERYARFWLRLRDLMKVASLLAGSGAIAALGAQSQHVAIGFGIAFALLQAIEFGVRPGEKGANGLAARKPYAQLLATEAEHDDAALEAAYQREVAADEVIVFESVRYLAYNDVVSERNCDPTHAYPMTPWLRAVAMLA